MQRFNTRSCSIFSASFLLLALASASCDDDRAAAESSASDDDRSSDDYDTQLLFQISDPKWQLKVGDRICLVPFFVPPIDGNPPVPGNDDLCGKIIGLGRIGLDASIVVDTTQTNLRGKPNPWETYEATMWVLHPKTVRVNNEVYQMGGATAARTTTPWT
jgi:hypothetical protein